MARSEQLEAGTIWAWREGKRESYTAVRILELAGDHRVWCERVERPGSRVLALTAHLRCEWERLDEFLEDYRWLDARLRSAQRDEPIGPWNPPWELRSPRRGLSEATPGHFRGAPKMLQRNVADRDVRDIVRRGNPRVVYSLQAAADECGVSEQFIRGYIRRNDLVAHYAGSKILILADDLRDWVRRLPLERE